MPRLIKYRLYKIKFHDHTINMQEEMIIEAVGFFVKSTRNAYVFSHWLVRHEDRSVVEDNLEPFAIVKKAILSIEEIKKGSLLQ